jgi:hypothetical protein
MAEESRSSRPVAGWFKGAAIASVLFMVLGCVSYVFNVTTDPATLSGRQRAIAEAVPAWMVAAFAVAVWIGLPGAVLLLMRRKIAEPLLLVSMIAVIVQFSAYFLDPRLREAMPSGGLLFPSVIVLLTCVIYGFARHARQRGWLR